MKAMVEKSYLRDLVVAVDGFLGRFDLVMKTKNDSFERGKLIAALINDLEYAKDIAKRFGLTGSAKARPAARTPKSAPRPS